MTERRYATVAAVAGAVLFIACALAAEGGPLAKGSYGDVYEYHLYQQHMSAGLWPYRNFFDEYPPLAQPLFYVVGLMPGSYVHAWRWTMVVLGAGSLVLLVATLASIGASRRRIAIAAATIGVTPLLLGQSIFDEFDLWPAFLAAAALLALVRRRETVAYVLLALAVSAKTYPLVFLPPALMATWERGGRELVKRGAAWFVGALVLVHLPFAIAGPGGLRFSYWVQLKRGLEVESLAAGGLLVLNRLGLYHVHLRAAPPGQTEVAGGLAQGLAAVTTLVSLAALVLVYVLYWRRRREPMVIAWAASAVAFVAFAKSFSPQYVDWLIPLVPAAGALASVLLLVIVRLTYSELQRFLGTPHFQSEHYSHVLTWWVVGRDLVVVALYAVLVIVLRRTPASSDQDPGGIQTAKPPVTTRR
jgi:glycosyl transferase family 87